MIKADVVCPEFGRRRRTSDQEKVREQHEAMAIDLQPNTNYQLVSGDHLCQDKVIVHVKLTDSCLRALQGFKNTEASSKHSPLIQFTGQNGKITIPTNSATRQQFMFNCSTLQPRDSQGCLDCIQQSSNNKTVMSFGSITHKINILATDDSYKMTQDRMKVVEEERKEIRTKVINTPGKVKKNRHITRQHNILKSVKRKIPNVPKISNGASKSLRDRVIHLLAVRPFKKPELIARLSKDGVRLDKNALTNILQQVTSLDNNQYNLLKHIYTEIKIDSWPYTDTEKQSVQKRIINSQTDTKTYLPPKNESIVDKPAESIKNKKRLSESTSYSNPANKKQRIARTVISNNNVTCKQQKDHPSMTTDVKTDKQSPPSIEGNKSSDSHVDYKKKYLAITSHDQRLSYRRDFEIEYKEYLELQHNINAVTKKFEELKETLEKCPQNSKQRQGIEKQVVALYQKQQQDPSWEINKKRCRDLHSKLAYIKELIKEYDGKRQDIS